jgi:hexosaminidase
LLACTATAPAENCYEILPRPNSLTKAEGEFKINAQTQIAVPPGEDWNNAAEFFKNLLATPAGFNLTIGQSTDSKNVIRVVQNDQLANAEGYVLNVTPELITIDAGTAAGAFYAFQTLRQMLPSEVEKKQKISRNLSIPCATIEDAPRFGYRGMMLDVSRHFFTVDEVKSFIDLLALHKMNRFHWHLTDDQGWRIEIKKYPKLTEVGAWRNETLIGHYGDRPRKFDSTRYGGFYTREQILEVVKYAQDNFIEIVPEVDLPGHMSALLAAYPEYGCIEGTYKVKGDWGVFEDLLMPSEATFVLLEDIFTEVIDMFPGKYIHIGGDEAVKAQWKKSPEVQAFMNQNKMKDEEAVQNYFTTRVAEMIRSKGREVIGWDEILEGGSLPTSTIIMSWRGVEGGIQAARHGNQAIMSPTSYAYLDYYQSKGANEPLAIGGYLPLEQVYSYEPVPENGELTPEQAQLLIGVQANVWTEYIGEFSKVQYMMLPRACAIAEIQWTPAGTKNYEEFVGRLTRLMKRFDAMDVNYAKSLFDVKAEIETKRGENLVTLAQSPAGTEIRYTIDGSIPSAKSTLYEMPVSVKQSCTFKAQTFVNKQPAGALYEQNFVMHKAVGASVTMDATPYRGYNPGNAGALVNGIEGNVKYNDKQWFGFSERDLTTVIDLGETQEIKSIAANFLHLPDARICVPSLVSFLTSNDGENYEQVFQTKPATDTQGIIKITSSVEVKARYIKMEALNFGVIFTDKEGRERKAWLFTDEVIVE